MKNNPVVKKVVKIEKIDYIKMNKQQIRDRSAKVHTQKFPGQLYSSTIKTGDEMSSHIESSFF